MPNRAPNLVADVSRLPVHLDGAIRIEAPINSLKRVAQPVREPCGIDRWVGVVAVEDARDCLEQRRCTADEIFASVRACRASCPPIHGSASRRPERRHCPAGVSARHTCFGPRRPCLVPDSSASTEPRLTALCRPYEPPTRSYQETSHAPVRLGRNLVHLSCEDALALNAKCQSVERQAQLSVASCSCHRREFLRCPLGL